MLRHSIDRSEFGAVGTDIWGPPWRTRLRSPRHKRFHRAVSNFTCDGRAQRTPHPMIVTSAPVILMEQYTLSVTLLRLFNISSMTRTIVCCIRQISLYISNDGRGSYRPLHPVSPTGWPRRRSGYRISQAPSPKHVSFTGGGDAFSRECPSRATAGLQPVVKRRGGPAV